MARYVIIALGFANGVPCPFAGQFLEAFDFNAFNGQGFGEFTHMKEHAKHFKTFEEAAEYWKRQSSIKPIRPDGKPNRPFTATTVEIKKVDDDGDGN